MPDFSSTAVATLTLDQWISEVKKAAKATKKLTDQTRRLADVSEKSERRLRKEAKAARRAAQEEARLAKAKRQSAKAYAAVTVAAFAAFRIIKKSVELAHEQERVERQVTAAIQSTGGAAGLTLRALKALATEQQRLTGIGDEVTLKYQSILLTFTKIGRDVFPAASRAVADIAVRFGTDLRSAAIQVGKALNDPIAGLDGLSRSGIQFSETQKTVIKTLAQSGKVAEAQTLVLKELEKQFGGSAEAARKDSTVLAAAIGDLAEQVGFALDPAVQSISRSMLKWVEAIIAVMQELGGLIGVLATLRSAFAEAMAIVLESIDSVLRAVADLPLELIPGFLGLITELKSDEELLGIADGFRDVASGLRDVADEQITIAINASNAALGRTGAEAEIAARAVEAVALSEKELAKQLKEQARQAAIVAEALRGVREAQRDLVELSTLQFMATSGGGLAVRAEAEILDRARQRAAVLREIESTGERNLRIQTEAIKLAEKLGLTIEQTAKLLELRQGGATESARAAAEFSAGWLDNVAALIPLFDQIEGSVGEIMSGLARGLEAGIATFRETGSALGSVLAGLSASGLVSGRTGGAVLGGAQAGFEFGSQFGPKGAAIGAAVGAAVGFITDALNETEQAFADGSITAAGIAGRIHDGSGEMLQQTQSILDAVLGIGADILESIGGQFTSFQRFAILKRDDSRGLRVAINDVWTDFGDNVEGAVDFIVTEMFRLGEVAGVGPEIKQALDNFAGGTIEGLQEVLALAFRNQQGRLGPVVAAVQRTIDAIMDDVFASLQAGIDPAGRLADLGRARDAVLGIEQDIVAQEAAKLDAFQAGLDMQSLQIRGMIAEIEARGAGVEAQTISTQALAQASQASIMAEGARIEAMGLATQATVQMALSQAQLLTDLRSLMADIEGLAITGAERAAALARAAARRAGGAARRGPTAARPTDFTEDLILQLTRLRLAADPAALAAFELSLQLEETQRQLDQSTLSEEQRLELLDLIRQQFADRELERQDEIARAAEDAQQAALDAVEALRDGLISAGQGVGGIIQQALPFIKDPAERERLQARLVEMEQALFRMRVLSAQVELESLRQQLIVAEALDPVRAAWIENLLGDLDVISANMEAIFDGIADDIVGAGQQFSQSVHDAAGALGGAIVPLQVLFRDLLPILSPPRSVGQIEAREGALLAQLLAGIENLQNPPGQVSPAQRLLQMAEDLEPFFEAFGLSFEEITAQIMALVESEALSDVQTSFEQFRAQFFGGGQFSGRTDAARLPFIMAELNAALLRGDDREATRLAQEGFQIAQGVSAAWALRFANIIRASALGSGIGPLDVSGGGVGTGADTGRPFTDSMNAFERQTAARFDLKRRDDVMLNAEVTERLDQTNTLLAQIAGTERVADFPQPATGRRVPAATLFADAGTKG